MMRAKVIGILREIYFSKKSATLFNSLIHNFNYIKQIKGSKAFICNAQMIDIY